MIPPVLHSVHSDARWNHFITNSPSLGGSLSPLHMLRPLVFAKISSTNCLFLTFVALIWKRPPLVSNFQYSAWLSLIWVFICKIVMFFFLHILCKFDFLEVSSVKSKNGFFFPSYNFCNVCHLHECSHIRFTNIVFNNILVIIMYCQNPIQLNSTQSNYKATSVGVRHSSHMFHPPPNHPTHYHKLFSHF